MQQMKNEFERTKIERDSKKGTKKQLKHKKNEIDKMNCGKKFIVRWLIVGRGPTYGITLGSAVS